MIKIDRFPEAFKRFERDVDIEGVEEYEELLFKFIRWGGKRAPMTRLQKDALNEQAKRLGLSGVP